MENIQKQKPTYYVFCGIDGVLWDIESGHTIHGPYLSAIDNPVLKRESVLALNLLLNSLEKNYDTKLVITSQRRKDLASCATYLSAYHLNYDKPLFATRFIDGYRGEKILNFMQSEEQNPQTAITLGDKLLSAIGKGRQNGTFDKYVVLDGGQSSRIKHQIPKERTIKTSLKKGALSIDDIINYLQANGLEIDEEYLANIAPKNTHLKDAKQMQ